MVSIIIPAYNCEKYLPACLESVQRQTCKDWEALIVDDGSSDNTGVIADSFAKKDCRFKVIHQENGGSSVARNKGLALARGDYVYFLDGDDRIAPYLLEHCIAALEVVPEASFVTFDFVEVQPNEKIEALTPQPVKPHKLPNALAFYLKTRRDHNVWMNLYRASSLVGLSFKPGIKHQDLLFQYQYLLKNKNGVYLSEKLYQYVLSPGSIMRSPLTMERIDTIFDILTELDESAKPTLKQQSLLRRRLFPRIVNTYRKEVIKAGKRELDYVFKERLIALLANKRIGFRGFSFRKKILLFKFILYNTPPQQLCLARLLHCLFWCEYKRSKNVFHVLGMKFVTHPRCLSFVKENNPEIVLSNMFKRLVGYSLNLENPQTFNEKIQQYKIDYMPNGRFSELADKFAVRKFVASRIGEEYLAKLYGCYTSAEEIDFDSLPAHFVIKPNHGSNWYKLVRNKTEFDWNALKCECNDYLRKDFSEYEYELQYRGIPRRLIVEEYLGFGDGSLTDYKVFCFNGVAKYIALYFDRQEHNLSMCYYDRNWKKQRFFVNYELHKAPIEKTSQIEKCFQLAETLSKGFPFVRVDFYILPNGNIKFGEMTFTPASGFGRYRRMVDNVAVGDFNADLKLGNLISL